MNEPKNPQLGPQLKTIREVVAKNKVVSDRMKDAKLELSKAVLELTRDYSVVDVLKGGNGELVTAYALMAIQESIETLLRENESQG